MMLSVMRKIEMQHVKKGQNAKWNTIDQAIINARHSAQQMICIDIEDQSTVTNPDRQEVAQQKLYGVEV